MNGSSWASFEAARNIEDVLDERADGTQEEAMSEMRPCPLCNQAPWVGPAPESDAFEIAACKNKDCPLHEIYMATETWQNRPAESRLERERDEARRDLADALSELARLRDEFRAATYDPRDDEYPGRSR